MVQLFHTKALHVTDIQRGPLLLAVAISFEDCFTCWYCFTCWEVLFGGGGTNPTTTRICCISEYCSSNQHKLITDMALLCCIRKNGFHYIKSRLLAVGKKSRDLEYSFRACNIVAWEKKSQEFDESVHAHTSQHIHMVNQVHCHVFFTGIMSINTKSIACKAGQTCL